MTIKCRFIVDVEVHKCAVQYYAQLLIEIINQTSFRQHLLDKKIIDQTE